MEQHQPPKIIVKPRVFLSASEEWVDWLNHFNVVAEANGWSEEVKCKFLPVYLSSNEARFYHQLDEDNKGQFNRLCKAMEAKLYPPETIELRKRCFKSRRQEVGESFQYFAIQLGRLCRQAYPTLDDHARGELVRDQFIDCIEPPSLRLLVRQSRPACLDDAVRETTELHALREVERSADKAGTDQFERVLEENTKVLTMLVEKLGSQEKKGSQLTCWKCGRTGHIQVNCRLGRRNQGNE